MKPPRTMHERLSALVPPPPPRPPGAVPPTPVDELTRILMLPQRIPYDCHRDPATKRYVPRTQALIEHETAKFTRGVRVSCACRPRRVTKLDAATLVVARILPPQQKPEAPRVIALVDFVRDCYFNKVTNKISAAEDDTRRAVQALAVGETVELPAAGDGIGHPCIIELNPTQAWILNEAAECGGVVAFAGAGSGKTYAWLLASLLFGDGRLAVLVIEPKQRRHYRMHYHRLREHFRVPTIVFDNDETLIVDGTVPVHLVSYSVLSLTKNSDLLDRKEPDILILDECHRACGESAINRRIKRYIAEKIREREAAIAKGERVRPRAVRLLDGSGTAENKSVQDMQMLCTYSLGTGSPLPLDPDVAVQFSQIIDPSRRPDRESKLARRLHQEWGDGPPGSDESFADLLTDSPESAVRQGFCKRRKETPGVVTTWASTANAAIYFGERKAPKIPPEVKAALEMVASGKRPDGEILEDRMHEVACAREVAAGFYNRWIFPKHPCSAPKGQECIPRCKQCVLIDHWFACRKLYGQDQRSKLLKGEVKLDSPALCQEAAERACRGPQSSLETYCDDCMRGNVAAGVPPLVVAWPCAIPGHNPAWRCASWPAWRDIEPKVEYKESVKWLSDYLAADAAKWGQQNTGIIWFRSTPFGRRVAELSGLPYFNGGPGCEDRLHAEKGDRSIICSIKALGAGTDGLQQKFYQALIAEMPASNGGNEGAEQLFARLHREGQPADVVQYEGYFHVPEFRDALRQVMVEAEWSKEMTTNPQRVLFADKDFSWL